MQYAPVIPPYPSPSGGGGGHASPRHRHEPPVVPPLSSNLPQTPAWVHPHPFPMNSPYTGTTPFVNGTPGSYFIPPTALPGGSTPQTPVAPVGTGGFSHDWTGFPNGFGPPASHPQTPYMTTAPVSHPQTPYMPTTPAAAHAPPPGTAYNAFQQQLPAGFAPHPAHQQQGQPQAMWGMQMGMPMGMTPMVSMGGMPGMGMPATTPYMGAMGGMPGMVPGMMPAGAWSQTPFPGGAGLPPQAAPPPAAPPQHPRRPQDLYEFAQVDRFAEGPHYGPVLEPFIVKKVRARVEINPLIQPPPESGERDYLKWSMLFTTTQCQRSSDPPHRSWANGRGAPATFPRVTSLRLISRALPWAVDVKAADRAVGVTCEDVMEAIQQYMYTKIAQAQYDGASPAQRRVLQEAFWHNRSTAYGVPGGKLPQTLLRMDWLGQNVVFGGIDVNEDLVRSLCGANLPCTFELKVDRRYPMTEAELRDQEARELAADERLRRRGRSRTGSRHTSASRATSRATSRGRGADEDDSDE